MRPSSSSPTGISQQVAGPLDRVALDDLVPLAEQHDADVVGLEVQRQPGDPVRQVEHLQRHAVVEAVDAGDAVGHGKDGADLREVGGIGLQPLDPLAQDACDLVRLDLHRVLSASLRRLGDALSKFLQATADARVEDHVSDLQDDAAEDLLVDTAGQLDLLAGLALDLLADLARRPPGPARRRWSRSRRCGGSRASRAPRTGGGCGRSPASAACRSAARGS